VGIGVSYSLNLISCDDTRKLCLQFLVSPGMLSFCFREGTEEEGSFPSLISGLPNVNQTNGRMESIEEGQGKGHVTQQSPENTSVEGDLLMLGVGGFDLKRLNYPHGNVADDEEGHELPAGLLLSELLRVRTSAKTINYAGCLENHLKHLSENIKNKWIRDTFNIYYTHIWDWSQRVPSPPQLNLKLASGKSKKRIKTKNILNHKQE